MEQGEPIITTIVEEEVSSTSNGKHRARAKNEEEATNDEEMLVDGSEKPTPTVNNHVLLHRSLFMFIR